jgi:Flp pilus assembly protein TadD
MKTIINIISQFKNRHTSIGTPFLGRIVFLIIFIASAQLYLPACVTMTHNSSAVIPIDQFPDLVVSEGQDISPASGVNAVPDVNILEITDKMKRLLDESVAKVKNKKKRLDALVEFALKNVQLDISKDTYGTKTAAETFETGTGNCLSFSNLLVAMARYVGLDAEFEEVPTPPNWIKNGEVLFFTRHIGVTVEVPGPVSIDSTILYIREGERFSRWTNSRIEYLFVPFFYGAPSYNLDHITTRSIPDNRAFSQYYNNIGSLHLAEGNNSEAFRYFVKAIEVDPELSYLWSNLGTVYSRNNQPDAAERVFLNALAINRGRDKLSSMTIMGNLSRLYTKQGRIEEATIYEKKVSSYRDRNPYYHYSLGETAFYDAQYEESIKHFKTAINRKVDEPQFHFALALAYQRLGDIEKADKSMDKAISYTLNKEVKSYYSQIWKSITESPISTN